MAASKLYRIFLAAGVSIGIVGSGWLLMKLTSPDKEEMMKRLPKGQVEPKALEETKRRNAELFKVIADNTKLNDPVWKVKGREDLNRIAKEK